MGKGSGGVVGSVVASVALGAVTGGIGYGLGFTTGASVFGLSAGLTSAMAAGAAMGAVTGVLGGALGMMAGGGQKPRELPFSYEARENKVTIRSSTETRKLLYGTTQLAGILAFADSTGSSKEYMHLVQELACREVSDITDVYFSDTISTDSRISGSLRVKKHLGAPNQTADSDLTAEVANWTSDHRGRSVAYGYSRVQFSTSVWPMGLPTVKYTVKGHKLYDPRAIAVGISSSAAGAPGVITTTSPHGASVNDWVFIRDHVGSAPSVGRACRVNTVPTSTTLTLLGDNGDPLTLTAGGTGGTLSVMAYSDNAALVILDYLLWRDGLDCSTDEIDWPYWISAANLCDEDVALAAGGTQKRYTINGTVDLGRKPIDIIEALLTSCGGVLVYVQGRYRLHPGAPGTASVTLDESDLRGPLHLVPRPPKRDLFNGVRGTFVDPTALWQPTEFPPQFSADYRAEDGGDPIYKDVDLAFVTDSARAQRLARLKLEWERQGCTVDFPAKLTALRVAPWDVVKLNIARLGWVEKEFRVIKWALDESGGVNLTLKEETAAVYSWSTGQEITHAAAPNTNLPLPWEAAAPTGLTVTSGSADLLIAGDGTVISRIKATWTAPADAFSARIEVEYKKSADSDWIAAPAVLSGSTAVWIGPVEDGVDYDVRVRSVNAVGVASLWTAVTGHAVAGKSAAPENVASFTAQQNGNVVTFRWSAVGDADRAGYEIRYMAAPFVWNDAAVLTRETKGTLVTNAGLPPGNWVVGIKAVDTSGNYSTNAATYAITVTNANSVVGAIAAEAGRWPGTLTGFIRHDVSGMLIPDSNSLAADLSDAELWDVMVFDPVASSTYEAAKIIDLGFDAASVRVWGSAAAVLGPGETGVADPVMQIDYRTAAGSYDGFEDWSVGTVAGRYVKARVRLDNTIGVAALSDMELTADAPLGDQDMAGVAVSASGTTITFDSPFFLAPSIQMTARADSGAARIAAYDTVTATSVRAWVFTTAGTAVSGTVDMKATGPY